jgi:hypothetical protein
MPDPRSIEARVKRLLSTWAAAGQDVGAVEIAPDGTIRILAPDAVTPLRSKAGGNTCDDVFSGTKSE